MIDTEFYSEKSNKIETIDWVIRVLDMRAIEDNNGCINKKPGWTPEEAGWHIVIELGESIVPDVFWYWKVFKELRFPLHEKVDS